MKEVDTELRQFKLSSGEEIVCEIMHWNDEENLEIVVRKAMRLVMQQGDDGTKYYSFRPWMIYQESSEDILVLNTNTVVGIAWPPETLIVQYDEAVKDMNELNEVREREHAEKFKTKPLPKGKVGMQEFMRGVDSGSNVINLFANIDPTKIH